jgi:CheY-like chemotaxis protein
MFVSVVIFAERIDDMEKKLIVYCDDQQRFLDSFISKHNSHYEIVTLTDTRNLLKTIEQLKKLPDLVLIDLYHPREDQEDCNEKALQAEISLAKLDDQIEETNKAVLNAWEPFGLEVLKLIRLKYSQDQLPVAMYTQKGLILLGDDELRQAELSGADWLIKKKLSARTEQIFMDRIMMRKQTHVPNQISKKYRWFLAFSWLLIGLLAARLFFTSNQFSDIAVAIMVGVVMALVTYLLSPLVTKPNID